MTNVLTIGYQGATIDGFISTLQEAKVETLVDVRDVPVSRKKGFSKRSLSMALEDVGINYVHLKALGDPKPGRDAARNGEHQKFLEIFNAHLATDPALDALQKLREICLLSKSCLLCFERDPRECHRSIVADKISDAFTIRHLGVN